MENFLSLLESVETSWLTPSSTTWAMDMIFAFVCGLGLFRLLLPLLPLDSPSPTPAENNIPQKVVRKEHRKVRKKIRTVKAYRGSRKKPEDNKVLDSHLHSLQERLVKTISICQDLGQDASCEAFKPDAAKAHLSSREPTRKSVATKSYLKTSSVPSKEHLLFNDSKSLSPVLPNSSPIESQSSVSACSPPETLTTGRRHSLPQQRAPSYPSHPRDPVACPPSMPDPSMATPHIERKILATSQSHILPGLPSPMPTTPETNLSRRPTLTTPGLNYSSRSTSTRPDLEHFSRPTSTTSGLDPFSRPTSIIPGLEHSSRPISDRFMYQITSRTLCHSTSSPDKSLKEDLSHTIHKTSYWTGPTDRQREAGEPSFISPVIQEMPEVQISQRVQLKVSEGKIKGRSDLSSSCKDSMLHSYSSKKTTIPAHSVWSKEFKLEQFSGHQRVLTHDLKEEYVQFYWGLPWLHSESLVAHVSMAGSPLDPPYILFNGLSTYSPLDINTKGLPQLCSPKPLLPHLVKSQPLSPKFSWSRTPSETRIQAKAHDPSSLSKLPCDSAPIRKDGASCLIPSRAKFIVSPRVQQLEQHLLKKYRESRCDLPVMVKRSLEAVNQQTSNSWGSQGQGPIVHLQGDYISPELREQTEEPFKKRLTQHQGQWPPKVQLSLGLGQAEVNQRISCPSAQENESGQCLQTDSPKGPDSLQPGRTPHKNLPNLLGRALEKDLYRPPGGSRGKVLEAFSEGETCHMRRQKSDLQSVSPVGPGKKQLGVTMRNNATPERKQTSDSEVPGGICYGVCVDQALVPSAIPKPNLETWNKPSFKEAIKNKNCNNGPSFLDPGTQKVLEAHIRRHLMRHRWRLPLRGLKIINILNIKKAITLPFPQSSNASMIETARDLGEPVQQAPERDKKTKASSVESQTTQNSHSVLQPALLREVQPNNNSVPSEAATTAQAFNVTSKSTPKCLVGRAWHRNTVVRSSGEYPEPNPCRVQGVWEPPESEGVTLRQNYHHDVSVREISEASHSSYSKDTRELEETEDEESCNWTRPTQAGKMGDVPFYQLLEISGDLASPSKTYSQDADDSSLSSAAGLALRDCAPGKVCQDWAPEVLLAADILASRTSRSTFKIEATTTKAPFLDRSSLSSRGRSVHKNCRLQGLQNNHSFVPNMGKDRCRSPPRQDTQLKRRKPVQSHTLNNENLWDRIKKFILSILIPKFKIQENPKQKCKGVPSITQSQGPLIGPCVPPNQLNRPVYHQETKKNQKSINTVYQANLKSKPSLDTGMPYGNKQAWATRDPVFRASPYYKRAHMQRAPGIPVCCPRHGHCVKV